VREIGAELPQREQTLGRTARARTDLEQENRGEQDDRHHEEDELHPGDYR